MSFSQLGKTDFFEKSWEKESRLFPAASKPFEEGLFSWKDIEARCRFSPAPGMDLNMPFRGNKVDRREYMRTDKVADYDKVRLFFDGGATLVCNAVQRFSNRLLGATRELETMVGSAVNTNLYLTPPGQQGFEVHSDTHDVFVLQTDGRKHWDLYDQPFPLLNRLTNLREKPDPKSEPRRQLTLETGDMLYVPRGEAHAAYSTKDTHSMHLTVGPQAMTWNRMLCDLITLAAEDDIALRRVLPVVPASAFPERDADKFPAQALEFFESINLDSNWEEAIQLYLDRIPGTCQPFPADLVHSVETLDAIERGELSCRWGKGKAVPCKTRDLEFEVPGRGLPFVLLEKLKPVLEWMREAESPFVAGDLSEFDLDNRAGLFCRYLANQGLLEPSAKS